MSWDDEVALDDAVGTPDAFRQTYGAAAEKVSKALGVDPNVILGQWGHETGWGKYVVPGTNNLGNIKGQGVKAKDNQTGSTDSYAKYSTPDDFANAYIKLIKTNYPSAINSGSNPAKFAQALKAGGYAEDRGYVPKVAAASAAVAKTARDDDWANSVSLRPLEDTQNNGPAASSDDDNDSFGAQAVRGLGLGARNVAAGIASPVTMVGDALNTGVNLGIRGVNSLTGANIPTLKLPSQVTQNVLTAAGLPVAETPAERVAGDIQQGAASAITGAGLAGSAAKAVANPVARNALAQLGENAVQQSVAGGTGAAAAGVTRELGGGPLAQLVAGLAGGTVPLTMSNLARSSDHATRTAVRLLNEALKDNSPADWNRARSMLAEADRVKIPMLGPELMQNTRLNALARDVNAAPEAQNALTNFFENRNAATEAAARAQTSGFGKNVGTQAASDQAQEAADTAVRNAQNYRTEAAGPYYQAQKSSDRQAIALSDQLNALPEKIMDLTASANSATQVSGKLHQFVNEQINSANNTIRRGLGWAGEQKVVRNLTRAEEGKSGVYEAINRAKQFRAQIDASQRQLESAADQLAQKNLPAVQGKVNSFLSKLDNDIRLSGDTPEGKVLKQYRDQLAPNGEALVLPSQLESVYKATRDKTMLGLNPTADERTTAGVLKSHVKDLDSLIKSVSPSIAAGRQIYEQLSKEVVDPLLKSPVGRVAGHGADAQKESIASRAMSELSGRNATPERISYLADQLGSVDKQAFPNLVRSYLEEQLNKSFKTQRGGALPAGGYSFRDALEGSPQAKTNLRTMIQKTAEQQGQDPTAAYEGFGRFLDVLDATGRLGRIPGSSSAKETAKEAGKVIADVAVDAKTAGAKTILTSIRNMARKKAYEKLANVFTSPYALREMADLSKLPPRDPKIVQGVASILRAGTVPNGPQPDEDGEYPNEKAR